MVIGTCASCRMLGALPPSVVTPQPAIVAVVPAAQRPVSAAPATFVGVIVDGRDSVRIEMS